MLPQPRHEDRGRRGGCSGSCSMPGCWLQALGGCLGTMVAPLLLSSLVSPAMAVTQLCRAGSTQDSSTFSKISRRP